MPLAIDRGMSVRYSGLRLGGVTHSSRMTAAVGAGLGDDAYLFSNDPAHARAVEPGLGHAQGR